MIKPLFQNVLIVINGTETSIRAAKYGILMAKVYKCKLNAIYVVDTATLNQLTAAKFFVPEESREYEQNLSSDGKKYLTYVQDLAKVLNVNVTPNLCYGSIYTETINFSEKNNIDLILLGGRDTNEGKFDALSHSYRQILNHADCSVLVVNEKKIEQMYNLAKKSMELY